MKKENWIKLESGIKDTLKGKVIDTYAFNKGYGDGEEESHLIIKFTDGTINGKTIPNMHFYIEDEEKITKLKY